MQDEPFETDSLWHEFSETSKSYMKAVFDCTPLPQTKEVDCILHDFSLILEEAPFADTRQSQGDATADFAFTATEDAGQPQFAEPDNQADDWYQAMAARATALSSVA